MTENEHLIRRDDGEIQQYGSEIDDLFPKLFEMCRGRVFFWGGTRDMPCPNVEYKDGLCVGHRPTTGLPYERVGPDGERYLSNEEAA